MSTLAAEDVLSAVQGQPDPNPAQQAMLVTLALAAAAEQGVDARMRAWWAGRISRVEASYSGATLILRAIAKALLAGEHFAELEWNHRVQPTIIRSGDHERLTRALASITADAERDRVADLARALDGNVEPSDTEQKMIMRSVRVAHAEVITAGRKGYAEAVAQAVGDDRDFEWRFQVPGNACTRCTDLGRRTFGTAADAPAEGGHPGCRCVLAAEMKGNDHE